MFREIQLPAPSGNVDLTPSGGKICDHFQQVPPPLSMEKRSVCQVVSKAECFGVTRKSESNIIMHSDTTPATSGVNGLVSVSENKPSSGKTWSKCEEPFGASLPGVHTLSNSAMVITTHSSGNGKNKWFPNQIGGSNERLKHFTSSMLCLL